MKNWKSPYSLLAAGYLDEFGEQEHYNISKRMLKRFYSLLSQKYWPKVFPIQSTQISRTARSANVFGFGIWEGKGNIGLTKFQPFYTYSESLNEDIILRFFDNCPKYEKEVLNNKTLKYNAEMFKNLFIQKTLSKVIKILGITPTEWNLTVTDINYFYKACTFDVAVFNKTDQFCKLFDEDDIKNFEYTNDLLDYYIKGYGNKLAYIISCPLLKEFFDIMDEVINQKTIQSAKFHFAHAETILPFISLLGLFKDNKPLQWNNSLQQIENRQWRTSKISPFAANIAFLLYNCSGHFRVKLMHNEQEYEFPNCNEIYCPYEKLKFLYQNFLKDCNFNQICHDSNINEFI